MNLADSISNDDVTKCGSVISLLIQRRVRFCCILDVRVRLVNVSNWIV